jgi:hypothetical protein
MVCVLLVARLNKYSNNTADSTQASITNTEERPKIIQPATVAGNNGIITSSIILWVVIELLI